MSEKTKFTPFYRLIMPDLSDPADIREINENSEIIDGALHGKADLGEDRKVLPSQLPPLHYYPERAGELLDARVSRLESILLNNIKKYPFLIAFDSLEGLRVKGVWNRALARVEF